MSGVSAASLSRWQCWWLAARPRTLTASVVPVLVALALAPPRNLAEGLVAVAIVVAALLIQVGVNFANDCFDAEAGIDTAERLGPTRAVQAGLISAAEMKRAFVLVLAAATLFGVPLVLRGGLPILAIGLVSMLGAWAYAGGPKPLASLGLGEVFVFVFFGVVPVVGTVWLLRLSVDFTALAVSIPVALLAVAIILVNNLRDIPTDSVAGKRTLAVRIGEARSRRLYESCVGIAIVWPLLLVPRFGFFLLLPLVALPLAARTIASVRERRGAALNLSLAETARLQLVQGLLLAIGILLAEAF